MPSKSSLELGTRTNRRITKDKVQELRRSCVCDLIVRRTNRGISCDDSIAKIESRTANKSDEANNFASNSASADKPS